jgi:hypothetical protein
MSHELQQELIRFFAQSREQQSAQLHDLLLRIRRDATVEGMASLTRPEQSQLEAAIAAVLPLEIRPPGRSPLYPGWTGGYTVVQLASDGTVLAAACKPRGAVYDLYGPNLYGFALAKAVIEQYLQAVGMRGGTLAKYEHLAQTIGDASLISIGSWLCHHPPGAIGVSGAEAGRRYTRDFGPGMDASNEEAAVNFAAGAADVVFAAGLTQWLADPAITVVKEPWLVGIGRLLH